MPSPSRSQPEAGSRKPGKPTAVDLCEGARRAVAFLGTRPRSPEEAMDELGLPTKELCRRLRVARLPKEIRQLAREVRAPMWLLVDCTSIESRVAMRRRIEAWRSARSERISAGRTASAAARRDRERLDRRLKLAAASSESDPNARRAMRLSLVVEHYHRGLERAAPYQRQEDDLLRLDGMVRLLRFLSGRTVHVSGAPGLARRIREALS